MVTRSARRLDIFCAMREANFAWTIVPRRLRIRPAGSAGLAPVAPPPLGAVSACSITVISPRLMLLSPKCSILKGVGAGLRQKA